MKETRILRMHLLRTLVVAAGFLAVGCSRDANRPGSPALAPRLGAAASSAYRAPVVLTQSGETPPAGVLAVSLGSEMLRLWPYTGESMNGIPSDPVNLIFAGNADPVRIRAALLNLDGDRTAYGFPAAYPFNARWSDAVGGVHTSYSEGEGWQASVIQLQLGSYSPIRAHLRLFRTGVPFGGGTWTVGGAHFEVLIPGTADHQVLSWELAQQLVVVDMIRSGLLDPATPYQPSDVINETPSFRTIPDVIYNGLPEELKAAIGGPAGSVSAPVPIASDGRATILHVTGEPTPQTGDFGESFTLTYNQVIPKPLCSDGPLDWVLVSGPVVLSRAETVDATGLYQYHTRIAGQLTITPVDVTANPPTPAGPSYQAQIGDLQQGAINAQTSWGLADSKRIAPQLGVTEFLMTRLRVASDGPDSYRARMLCP
ncbi:MAG TPA: hypothetical protein VK527_02660 [Candidatus Limnocylindrales bacterium]|nr:hypothetical protein [Candidatus Limnocylindrales bacterium]